MARVRCSFNKSEVNRAGQTLVDGDIANDPQSFIEAWDVMNAWRTSHSYPINTFQVNLRRKLHLVDKTGFVAQRLKREASIVSKLRRFPTMQLAQMQDIGGLRAVVKNVSAVNALRNAFVASEFKHILKNEKDYIKSPKPSGYRSIHLVYRYNSAIVSGWNDHQLEIQIRTKLQHSWATAVETMEIFLKQSLKASEGSAQWLEFFSLTGSAFARIEKSPPLPQYAYLDAAATFAEVKKRAVALDVVNKLRTFGLAVKNATESKEGADYFILLLKPQEKLVEITGYDRRNLGAAAERYAEKEKSISKEKGEQVVLVKAESLDGLKKAYPNYFLDTDAFLAQISRIIDVTNS